MPLTRHRIPLATRFALVVNDFSKCLLYSNLSIYEDGTSQDVSQKSNDIIEQSLHDDNVNSMKWMERNKLTII